MNKALLSVIVTAPFVASGFAMPANAQSGKPWKCTARGLVSGSYNGGSTAYIHLSGFSTGGTYPVKKKGNVATGVTANGTKFTCRQ